MTQFPYLSNRDDIFAVVIVLNPEGCGGSKVAWAAINHIEGLKSSWKISEIQGLRVCVFYIISQSKCSFLLKF